MIFLIYKQYLLFLQISKNTTRRYKLTHLVIITININLFLSFLPDLLGTSRLINLRERVISFFPDIAYTSIEYHFYFWLIEALTIQ